MILLLLQKSVKTTVDNLLSNNKASQQWDQNNHTPNTPLYKTMNYYELKMPYRHSGGKILSLLMLEDIWISY